MLWKGYSETSLGPVERQKTAEGLDEAVADIKSLSTYLLVPVEGRAEGRLCVLSAPP